MSCTCRGPGMPCQYECRDCGGVEIYKDLIEALHAAQFYIEKNGIDKDAHTYPLVVNALAKAKGESND